MKQRLLVIGVFVFSCFICHSQSFVSEQNKWIIANSNWIFASGPNPGQWSSPEYFFYWFKDGETIQGVEYLQLNQLRVGVPGSSISYLYNYRETDDGKVYIHNGTEDILLYDFNLSLGDTLDVNGRDEFIAIELDTIQLWDGIDRKVIRSQQGEIIEGIGRNYTPFYEILGFLDVSNSPVCFYINNILTYNYGVNTSDGFSCEDFGLTDIEDFIERTNISLNLSDNKVFISNKMNGSEHQLSLYNMTGQQIGTAEYTSGYFDVSTFDIPSGMVVGQLRKDGRLKHTQLLLFP